MNTRSYDIEMYLFEKDTTHGILKDKRLFSKFSYDTYKVSIVVGVTPIIKGYGIAQLLLLHLLLGVCNSYYWWKKGLTLVLEKMGSHHIDCLK